MDILDIDTHPYEIVGQNCDSNPVHSHTSLQNNNSIIKL